MLTSNLAHLNNSPSGHLNHPVVNSLHEPNHNKLFDEERRKYFNQNREANHLPEGSKSDLVAICDIISTPHFDSFNSQLVYDYDLSASALSKSNRNVLDLVPESELIGRKFSHIGIEKTELDYRKRNEMSQELDMIDSLFLTGQAHEKLGEFDEALRHFEKSLELSMALGHHETIESTLNRVNSIHERLEARRKI